ncbi:MAG: YncE family protein, partial [Chloroflexota bacterium]|nr:YncE family protein [Chloroflexota bacterium]
HEAAGGDAAGGRGAGARAYVANEATGTISVIDTATDAIVATIGLGSDPALPDTPQPNGPDNAEPDHHKAFYNGHVAPHGLWLTPDGALLLVAARLSGTVIAIDTATQRVLGYTPVGREPHLATVRPGGGEAWVAVRGEDYVDVLQLDRDALYAPGRRRTDRLAKVATVDTMPGPSMVAFTADGRSAFVAAGKAATVQKVDAATRRVVASRAVPTPFTPFGLVSPDDRELYLVHKGAGTLSILRTGDLGPVVEGLPLGPRANHLFFVGKLAYITVGGPAPGGANADPEGKIVIVDRTTHAIVHQLTGPAFAGEPHAIWATPDGRLYVGHERGNRVTVIATGNADDPFDDSVAGTVSGSPHDLAFLKQPIDIVISGRPPAGAAPGGAGVAPMPGLPNTGAGARAPWTGRARWLLAGLGLATGLGVATAAHRRRRAS